MRQMLKDIEARLKIERFTRDSVVEWQTKVLASFIAGTVQVEKGKPNTLAKEVEKIKLVDPKTLGRGAEIAPSQKDEDNPEIFVEEGSQVAADRNTSGSFEALMNGFRERPTS